MGAATAMCCASAVIDGEAGCGAAPTCVETGGEENGWNFKQKRQQEVLAITDHTIAEQNKDQVLAMTGDTTVDDGAHAVFATKNRAVSSAHPAFGAAGHGHDVQAVVDGQAVVQSGSASSAQEEGQAFQAGAQVPAGVADAAPREEKNGNGRDLQAAVDDQAALESANALSAQELEIEHAHTPEVHVKDAKSKVMAKAKAQDQRPKAYAVRQKDAKAEKAKVTEKATQAEDGQAPTEGTMRRREVKADAAKMVLTFHLESGEQIYGDFDGLVDVADARVRVARALECPLRAVQLLSKSSSKMILDAGSLPQLGEDQILVVVDAQIVEEERAEEEARTAAAARRKQQQIKIAQSRQQIIQKYGYKGKQLPKKGSGFKVAAM